MLNLIRLNMSVTGYIARSELDFMVSSRVAGKGATCSRWVHCWRRRGLLRRVSSEQRVGNLYGVDCRLFCVIGGCSPPEVTCAVDPKHFAAHKPMFGQSLAEDGRYRPGTIQRLHAQFTRTLMNMSSTGKTLKRVPVPRTDQKHETVCKENCYDIANHRCPIITPVLDKNNIPNAYTSPISLNGT